MGLRQEIKKALNTPFDALAQGLDPTEYFGLGVWHDGPTLEESWIKISREVNTDTGTFKDGRMIYDYDPTAETQIDILDKRGTGKGEIKDIFELKNKFNKIRRVLPPGDYQMNADDPTKAKYYMREFLKDPWFSKSGQKHRAKKLNKRTGEYESIEYESMVMNVPENKDRIKTKGTKSGFNLDVPNEVVQDEFTKYIKKKYETKDIRVEDNAFVYDGKGYGFEASGDTTRSLKHDGKGYKLYRSGDKKVVEANRRAVKLGLTPQMNEAEWLEMRDIYRKGADLGLEVDHIQPLELGGLHHPRNLQLLTREHNRMKGTTYASDLDTKKLQYSDAAVEFDRPIAHSKKDYSWARKNARNNNVLKHIDGFSTYGRRTDAYANLAANVASGNYVGAAVSTVPIALQSKPVQQGLVSLVQRFGKKRAAALAPGAGAVISGLETSGYLGQGRNIQAGVAALSGVTGEIPILEPISVALDLGNTVTDYLTGNYKTDVDDEYDPNKRTTYDVPGRASTWDHLGLKWRYLK